VLEMVVVIGHGGAFPWCPAHVGTEQTLLFRAFMPLPGAWQCKDTAVSPHPAHSHTLTVHCFFSFLGIFLSMFLREHFGRRPKPSDTA